MTTTKIYKYGCRAPIEGLTEFNDQLWRAHRYRHALVEIECNRREGIARVQREFDALAALLEIIDNVETAIGEARCEAKLTHAGGGDPERRAALREFIEALQADLAILRVLRTATKFMLRISPEERAIYELCEEATTSPYLTRYVRPWQRLGQAVYAAVSNSPSARLACEYAIVDDMAKEAQRRARAQCGLTPGTYLVVEQAAERWRKSHDAPRKRRYDGQGRIAVQLHALSIDDAEAGRDFHLQLSPEAPVIRALAPEAPRSNRQQARAIAYGIVHFCRAGNMIEAPRGGRGKTKHYPIRHVRLRVGSNGRQPVWATFPVLWHRDLPPDGVIMWAWVKRTRLGVRHEYELQITVREPIKTQAPREGMVALDIGSRDLPDGRIRAAYWMDDQGRRGEILLPTTRKSKKRLGRWAHTARDIPNDLQKCEDIQAIRSRHLDEIKQRIAAYRVASGAAAASPRANPVLDWLREATARVTTWRSPARVGRLLRQWERHAGDEEIHRAISTYLNNDRHLLDWEVNERKAHLNRRKSMYLDLAARFSCEYGTILVSARDYRREEWVPEQAPSTQAHESRKIMRGAAPGEFREKLKLACQKNAARYVEQSLAGDTAWCVDWRVCEQLLASGEVPGQQAEVLAKPKRRKHYGIDEQFTRRRLGTPERLDPLAN